MTSKKKLSKEQPKTQLALYVWDNPGKVFDRNGGVIDTTKEIWVVNNLLDNFNLDWNKIKAGNDVKDAMKVYIAHCIKSFAPGSVNSYHFGLRYFLSMIPYLKTLQDLTFSVLEMAFIKIITEGNKRNFTYIRIWYRWCCNQNLPGFEIEILKKLETFKIKGIKNHLSVMTRNPNKGPFDEVEFKLICDSIKDEKGSLLDRVCIMLSLELGARPAELAMLKEQDFHVQYSPSKGKFYSLDIPNLKQKIVKGCEKKRRSISPNLGVSIEKLIENNHSRYSSYGAEMPLICCARLTRRKLPEASKEIYSLHIGPLNINNRICRYAEKIQLISPRTGNIIHLNPYRFRYTFATRLAEQGAPSTQIAELLGHSNLSNVSVYVNSRSNAVERLNETLGIEPQYTNIINRFLGKIADKTKYKSLSPAIPGITPTLKNLGGIGKCGANKLCNLYPPLSCYICPQFIAWKDGPHKQMLNEIETYVEFLREQTGNPSDRIPKQLDDVLAAIRTVVKITKQ